MLLRFALLPRISVTRGKFPASLPYPLLPARLLFMLELLYFPSTSYPLHTPTPSPPPIPQNLHGKIPCITTNYTMILIPLFRRCGLVLTTGTRIRKSFIRSSLRHFYFISHSLLFPSLSQRLLLLLLDRERSRIIIV